MAFIAPDLTLKIPRQMRKQSRTVIVSSQVNRFRLCSGLALTLALALLPLRALATTVVAPNFDSLVSQADYVVRGRCRASFLAVWPRGAKDTYAGIFAAAVDARNAELAAVRGLQEP